MESEIYQKQGFGQSAGLGERPALVIVDFVNGFTDPDKFGGGNIREAVACTVGLLAFARQHGWPVIHTRVVFSDDGADRNVFSLKVPSLLSLTEHVADSHIVVELTPREGELVIRKQLPSAFAGTSLAAYLAFNRVDSVVVAGCTTSGCIRATVLDALNAGLRIVVPRDCVGDRAISAHEANLFDMHQKYADVMDARDLYILFESKHRP